MILRLCVALLLAGGAARQAGAADMFDFSEHRAEYVLEAGALITPLVDTSGAYQPNATNGWHTTAFTWRAEAWLTRPGALALGLVAQPMDVTLRGTFSSQLDARGRQFNAGQPGSLNFQFPSVRATANYPVWANDRAELRLGASLIARYAEQTLRSGETRLKRNNTLALPLLNIAATARIAGDWSAVLRADLLPAENGTGIYDAFVGLRYALPDSRAVEFGGRTFYGGYRPNKSSDINSRVLFQGVVARLVF